MENKNRKKEKSFCAKVMNTLGKVVFFALIFPYQIIVNRKESKFTIRSLLFCLSKEKDSDGKANITVDIPGFALPCGKKGKERGDTKDAQ